MNENNFHIVAGLKRNAHFPKLMGLLMPKNAYVLDTRRVLQRLWRSRNEVKHSVYTAFIKKKLMAKFQVKVHL